MAFIIENCNFTLQCERLFFKKGKECHVTLWSTPSLPHVLFGDTVASPRPSPRESHIV